MWPFSKCQDDEPTGEVKNIVVVGASIAGHTLVNSLASSLPATHRILLVERNSFIVYTPTIVRSVVVPGWEEKNLTARLAQETVFPANSRHRVLAPNSVIELRRDSVVLEHPFEGSTEVSFEKCIIATGAQQPLPMRPAVGSSLDDYKTVLREIQSGFKDATKIAIIGGGSTGVEVAGELNKAYPDKEVSVVHSSAGLLRPGGEDVAPADYHTYNAPPTPAQLSSSLQQQLESRGVNLVLNDRVKFPQATPQPGEWDGRTGRLDKVTDIPLDSGKTVQADYIFLSSGNTPNAELVKEADPSALTNNGLIAVNEYFRVQPKSEDSILGGEYYALGDVASMRGNKTYAAASAEGPALASIISAEVRGAKPAPYTPSALSRSMVVTLGDGGAGVLVLPFVGQLSAPGALISMKARDFMAGRNFFSHFKGPEGVGSS